jgi:ADP-ribosylglycohydrolase
MSSPSTSVRTCSCEPTVEIAALSATPPSPNPLTPTVRSALWAAWADALGFQTELARDGGQVQRRLGADWVETTLPWKRRVGGRYGPEVELPAGAYSDDTQLRLAVGRCLRANGRFDVEAFSKIELPVFLSYELGAGVGTKAAASALGRRSVRWNSNFFETHRSRYITGGGNGAAMRIQPHVWAAPEFRPDDYLPGVLRDAVITHGHPRGILGAALHALALGSTLREGAVPEPERWPGMVGYLSRVPDLMREDDALAERWLPLWEERAARSWREGVDEIIEELVEQVQVAVRSTAKGEPAHGDDVYAELADRLGGLARETRGSGAATAVLSLWLAWTYREAPADGVRVAANLIGSDTDTIASLAGALLGAVVAEEPPGALLDQALIGREAARLERMREGERVEDFPHPDPLHWRPPPTLSDAVGQFDGRPAIAGLGAAEEASALQRGRGKEESGWQWLMLSFGQHALVKRRKRLTELPDWARPRPRDTAPRTQLADSHAQDELPKMTAAQREPEIPRCNRHGVLPAAVEDGVSLVIKTRFEELTIIKLLFHYARQPHGTTKAALFAALVAERLREREGLDDPHAGRGEMPDEGPGARRGNEV